jgi:hypothetical protein
MSAEQDNEPLPVDQSIQVIRFKTIYKTKKWWKAAVVGNVFGHNQVMVFLWILDEKTGKWKRKQKLAENSIDGWEQTKAAMDEMLKGGL